MKRYILVMGGLLLFFILGFSSLSHALLAQSINPDESWLTIYQDIDRAWVAEKVTLSLHPVSYTHLDVYKRQALSMLED